METPLQSRARSAAVIVLTVMLGACGSAPATQHATPPYSPLLLGRTYPLEVQYELLGVAHGKACGPKPKTAGMMSGGSTVEQATVGQPSLYQEAKFTAIESIEGADNLLFIRAKADGDDTTECVTVIGRAYRVKWLGARAPSGVPAAPAPSASEPRHPTMGSYSEPSAETPTKRSATPATGGYDAPVER